eukprot:TRINITY_DN15471_c0_g1_i1.p1 TRINITY_DN15471_c0_g1~~TRINITY_DN15471_c0_g1_i1.p1  ORF type:complete len:246 (+),score=11.28 TRINITY_DN15471_c0_g1_i1:29-766(+)
MPPLGDICMNTDPQPDIATPLLPSGPATTWRLLPDFCICVDGTVLALRHTPTGEPAAFVALDILASATVMQAERRAAEGTVVGLDTVRWLGPREACCPTSAAGPFIVATSQNMGWFVAVCPAAGVAVGGQVVATTEWQRAFHCRRAVLQLCWAVPLPHGCLTSARWESSARGPMAVVIVTNPLATSRSLAYHVVTNGRQASVVPQLVPGRRKRTRSSGSEVSTIEEETCIGESAKRFCVPGALSG